MSRGAFNALIAVLAGGAILWGMSGSLWALLVLLILGFIHEGVTSARMDWRR